MKLSKQGHSVSSSRCSTGVLRMTLEELIKQQVRNHASYVDSYTPTLFKDRWVRQNREFTEENMNKLIDTHLKVTTNNILRAISKNKE